MNYESFNYYLSACEDLREELSSELSQDELNDLRRTIQELGKTGFLLWCSQHQNDIRNYVQSTPAKRRSRESWQDRRTRGLLVLASLHWLERAKKMLNAVNNLLPTYASRAMAAQAGDWFQQLVDQAPVRAWPFADDGPNPFAP